MGSNVYSSTRAFTLVELAIVITIIGLLIGGVLKGQELLENSRMTAVANQMKSYEAAITTFRDTYKGLPGDTNNATNFITGCTAGNNCANGDNNGRIDGDPTYARYWYPGFDSNETFQSWKHMALAGLITGVSTTVARPATYIAGTHVPKSPMNGMFFLKSNTGDNSNDGETMPGIVVLMSTDPMGAFNTTNGSQAMRLDIKMDDGIAQRGDVQSVSVAYTAGCGYVSNGANGYNPNASGLVCAPGFRLMNN